MSARIESSDMFFYYNNFYDALTPELVNRIPAAKQAVIESDLDIAVKMDLTKILDALDTTVGVYE